MSEENKTPTPANRMIDGKSVKVRALGWIAEEIGGKVQTFKPGEEFSIAADRAKALGKNVEILKG
jgi:hypothetical protein